MKILYFLNKIGFLRYSDDEIAEYYATKKIIKKYGKRHKAMMRKKATAK